MGLISHLVFELSPSTVLVSKKIQLFWFSNLQCHIKMILSLGFSPSQMLNATWHADWDLNIESLRDQNCRYEKVRGPNGILTPYHMTFIVWEDKIPNRRNILIWYCKFGTKPDEFFLWDENQRRGKVWGPNGLFLLRCF